MDTFDPSAFLQEDEAVASPGTEQSEFNPEEFLQQGQLHDELTGEDIPLAFSGLSPETARNKSIVSGMDRLKLSAGNLQGNVQYLKSKFQDVRPIKNAEGKDSDELAVLDKGTWYRVDPENGEIADPWEKTKEYLKDVADAAPFIVGVAASAAAVAAAPVVLPALGISAAVAGTAATGAAGAAAIGAGTAAIRTSLGRAIGTYEATPIEQAFDIGLESLLNAAGVKVAAGIKPGASWMADKIPKLAEAFRSSIQPMVTAAENNSLTKINSGNLAGAGEAVANSSKDLLKNIFAGFSVGVDNFDTMLQHPNAVKATMKNAWARAGRNIEAFHDDITLNQLNQVKNFSDNARQTLSKIYGQARNRILGTVNDGFEANFDDALVSSYRDALSKGIGKIDLGNDKVLKGAEALEWLNTNGIKGFTEQINIPAVTKEIAPFVKVTEAAKTASRRLRPRFQILSQAEMEQSVKQGAQLADDLGYLATNAEAHGAVSGFFNDIGKFAGSANRRGVKAAEDLLNFKRVVTDKAYDLANQEHVASMPGVKRILDQARANIDDSIFQSLNKAGPGAGREFIQLNKTYSDLSNEMVPLLNARNQYQKSGDLKVYEGLLNRFLSRPGKNISSKYAIDQTIDAAKVFGLKDLATELTSQKTAVQVGQAAKAFNPVQSGFSKAATTTQAMVGMYALASASPPLMAAVAGGAILRSPKTPRAAAALVQGMFKGQELLSSLPKSQLSKAISDPKFVNPLINGITSAPLVYEKTKQALDQKIQQTMSGQ